MSNSLTSFFFSDAVHLVGEYYSLALLTPNVCEILNHLRACMRLSGAKKKIRKGQHELRDCYEAVFACALNPNLSIDNLEDTDPFLYKVIECMPVEKLGTLQEEDFKCAAFQIYDEDYGLIDFVNDCGPLFCYMLEEDCLDFYIYVAEYVSASQTEGFLEYLSPVKTLVKAEPYTPLLLLNSVSEACSSSELHMEEDSCLLRTNRSTSSSNCLRKRILRASDEAVNGFARESRESIKHLMHLMDNELYEFPLDHLIETLLSEKERENPNNAVMCQVFKGVENTPDVADLASVADAQTKVFICILKA